jgi:hypothetical protein
LAPVRCHVAQRGRDQLRRGCLSRELGVKCRRIGNMDVGKRSAELMLRVYGDEGQQAR